MVLIPLLVQTPRVDVNKHSNHATIMVVGLDHWTNCDAVATTSSLKYRIFVLGHCNAQPAKPNIHCCKNANKGYFMSALNGIKVNVTQKIHIKVNS
jgi:hypothetical protein